jgi:hypothetical protein
MATVQTSSQFHALFSESMMELMLLIKYIQKLCGQVSRQYKGGNEDKLF